ncbi:MAG: ATP-binding cassette domain-containing protein [Nocardiopsaceae bacterium]|jgi:ATPase subunit of ABC transporter with duplicated ATPase domains|nr:ATP-binding cassette domain-containing protein [Nocardiopsaceae bacterium]
MSHSIVVSDLRFAWPDGAALFDGLSFAAGPGRSSLIGANGAGKSTLLRLIAGELAPASGTVRVRGSLGYLPQDLTLQAGLPADEVLGIAGTRRALHAIERGEGSEADFTAVGGDWDIEERARATLDRLGLPHIGLDRRVGQVSGGETVLLGLTAQLLRRPDVLLLDEPTNNLDLAARDRLYAAVAAWPGVMLIVSHDRGLLELAGQTGELRAGPGGRSGPVGRERTVRWYGGNLSAYEAAVAAEQEAAQRGVRAAESDLRRQRRELAEAPVKLDRRRRYGQKMYDTKREPRAVMNERKREAQVSAGKHRIMQAGKVEEAAGRLAAARELVRGDEAIRIDLPATAVPAGRTVLTASGARLRGGACASLEVRGPERIALLGANGAGKTALLQAIAGPGAPLAGTVTALVPVRYLPQRLDILDDAATVAGNVSRFAPSATPNTIRARLARFGFRGARADQVAGGLSGGERFRASLAALLLAEPAPQLLLLDEPTNSLDLASAGQLSQALAAYRGALIVASHDLEFLRGAGVTRWLRLAGTLSEIDPP